MTRKPLKPEDEALWRSVTQDVTPLGKKSPRDLGPPPKRPMRRPQPGTADDVPPPISEARPQALAGLDGSRARKLKRGLLPVEARLDLHGMTQDKAYARLRSFLARAQDEGKRVVLVITGKGGAANPDQDNIFRDQRSGVLRALVPQWLAEGDNAPRVVAWHPAHKKHGGDGALYVVVRRVR